MRGEDALAEEATEVKSDCASSWSPERGPTVPVLPAISAPERETYVEFSTATTCGTDAENLDRAIHGTDAEAGPERTHTDEWLFREAMEMTGSELAEEVRRLRTMRGKIEKGDEQKEEGTTMGPEGGRAKKGENRRGKLRSQLRNM